MTQLQFIGATGTVTGSKYLLTSHGKKYLVDCGLFQGLKVLRLRNWQKLPFNAADVEAVILTHAHIDHSGYLPLLVKNGFQGKIYASEASFELCKIMLPDSARLQEEDAGFANKHRFSKHDPALPLYTEADARRCLEHFCPVPWETEITLSKKLSFSFLPAGHILGAAMARFDADGKTILFSGDLGRPHHPFLKPPAPVREADYLILESTYGDRTHPKENPKHTLKRLIEKTVRRGGIVLIPTFAVGRAQEILYLLGQLKNEGGLPDVPIYLNSPMSVQTTRLYRKFTGELQSNSDTCDLICDTARFVSTVEESKRLNLLPDPSIILSASGMATGGRVLHHLKALVGDPKNLILLAGFQAAGTRGEALIRGADSVKIHGELFPVRAEVAQLDSLSAHADAGEIMGWLSHFKRSPKMTYLTHGEPVASDVLRKKILQELGWNCSVPDYLEEVSLK